MEYIVSMPMSEFRENIVEIPKSCLCCVNTHFKDIFGDGDTITIQYKYIGYCSGITSFKWRVYDKNANTQTPMCSIVQYTGSTLFAEWWCNLTDDIEMV